MTWALDHIILTTILIIAVVIALMILILRYVPKLVHEQMAGTVASTTISVAVALLVGVFLNGLYAAHRDRNSRLWSAKQQHLERLRPILRTDTDNLAGCAEALRKSGFVATPYDSPAMNQKVYDNIWQTGNPLVADLQNHFPAYAAQRRSLEAAVASHEAAYRGEFQRINAQLTTLNGNEWRPIVAHAILKQCTGVPVTVSLRVASGTFSFQLDGNAGGGGGNPPVEVVAEYEAFKNFVATPTVRSECSALRTSAQRIAASASALSGRARELSEHAYLEGACQFVQVQ